MYKGKNYPGTSTMPLLKIEDFEPKYRESFDDNDIKAMDVYTEGGKEKLALSAMF